MTGLKLEVIGETCIGRIITLPITFIDGAVEGERSFLRCTAAVLGPDVDLYQRENVS